MKTSFNACSLNHLFALIVIAAVHTSCHSTKNASQSLQENINTTETVAQLSSSASLDSVARSLSVELNDVEIVIEETSADSIAIERYETVRSEAEGGLLANNRYPKRTFLRAKSVKLCEDGKASRTTMTTAQQADSMSSEVAVNADLSDNRSQTQVFAPPDKWSWLIAFVIAIGVAFAFLYLKKKGKI